MAGVNPTGSNGSSSGAGDCNDFSFQCAEQKIKKHFDGIGKMLSGSDKSDKNSSSEFTAESYNKLYKDCHYSLDTMKTSEIVPDKDGNDVRAHHKNAYQCNDGSTGIGYFSGDGKLIGGKIYPKGQEEQASKDFENPIN